MALEPLPFSIRLPNDDHFGLTGTESTKFRIDGLLHITEPSLFVEWAETRTIERFSLGRVGTDIEELPVEMLEIPLDWISALRLIGGWWAPRIQLQARRLDAFESIPGGHPGSVTLWIKRRDRDLAREIGAAFEARRARPAEFRTETTRQLAPVEPPQE